MSQYEAQLDKLRTLANSQKESDKIRAALRDMGFVRETQGEILLTFIILLSLVGKAKSWGITEREIDQEIKLGRHLGKLAIEDGIIIEKRASRVEVALRRIFQR